MQSTIIVTREFSTKPLVAAVAMALFAPAVLADNGMPGAGLVVRNFGAGVTVNGVALPGGNQIIGLSNGATIQSVSGVNTVIQWGSPAVLDTANTPGFNLASGKTLNFTSVGPTGILNIDISGTLSKIDGKIVADNFTYLAIANEKGITVSSGATISGLGGVSLVGSNMNTIDAINTFASSNGLPLNFAGNSPVNVFGDFSGVGTALLVAGSGTVNVSSAKMPTGGYPTIVVGGVGSDYYAPGGININDTGPASATVRSSAPTDVTIGLTATPLLVWANGDLTNTGTIFLPTPFPLFPALQWTGKLINTGTITTSFAAVGLDLDVIGNNVPWYGNTASPLLAGQGGLNNSGTISNPTGWVDIGVKGAITNTGTITAGNGYLEVTTTSGAIDNSGTMTSSNTINISTNDGNVTNSGTITAANFMTVWAGSNKMSANPHNIVNTGKMTSSNSYISLYSEFGSITNSASGVITATDALVFANNGDGPSFGNATNAGAVNITSKGGAVEFYNRGNGDVTVGGTVVATGAGNYIGYFSAAHDVGAGGTTTVTTPITVLRDKGSDGIYLAGNKIVVSAPLAVSEATPGSGAGGIEFYGVDLPGNMTTISANLIAGNFEFSTGQIGPPPPSGSPYDMAVLLNGNLTTTAGGYRTVEMYDVSNVTGPGVITTNRAVFDTSGNVRNPVSNNYLLNGLHITTVGTDPVITINARSPAVQAINLAITGDATITSGQTVILNNACYSGLCTLPSGGYIPQSNAGSSLLVTATGNLTIGANNVPGAYFSSGGGGGGECDRGGPPAACAAAAPATGGLSNTNGFLFPGGVSFVAGGALNVNTVLDNAFTGTALPFQGVYFQGTTINALQPIYTNGNSFVNYSVRPNGGVGMSTTYQAHAGTNFLGFPNLSATLNPFNSYLNTYTVLANAVANGQPWLPLVNTTPFTQ